MLAVNPSGAGTPFSTMWRRSSFVNHIRHRGAAATDAHYPHHFRNRPDPVGSGLVASLPRPGGHTTGFTNIEGSRAGKWLELLKQIARASTVSPCCSIRQPHPTPKFILALSGPRRPLSPWRRSPRLWAIRPNSNPRSARKRSARRFYGDSGSLHVQPERTDHFADRPSPPSSELSVSFLR